MTLGLSVRSKPGEFLRTSLTWDEAAQRLSRIDGQVIVEGPGLRELEVRRLSAVHRVQIYYARTGNVLKTVCELSPTNGGLQLRFRIPRSILAGFGVVAAAFVALPFMVAVYALPTQQPGGAVAATVVVFASIAAAALALGTYVAIGLLRRERVWKRRLRSLVLAALA